MADFSRTGFIVLITGMAVVLTSTVASGGAITLGLADGVTMTSGELSTSGAAGDIRGLLAGFDAYNGVGAANYVLDLTAHADADNRVALRGWVDTSMLPPPSAGEFSPWYFGLNMRSVPGGNYSTDREQLTVNFAAENLGGWYGLPAGPWERLRLEYTQIDQAPFLTGSPTEEWYTLMGGTHDQAGGGTIYPSDRLYYVQETIDLDTNEVMLQVWGKGNGGDQAPPNSNNVVDDKQWYTAVQTWDLDSIAGMEFDFSAVGVEFYLATTPYLGTDESATVRWYDFQVGAPLSTQQAAPSLVPLPAAGWTGLALLAGLAAFSGRRRRLRARTGTA